MRRTRNIARASALAAFVAAAAFAGWMAPATSAVHAEPPGATVGMHMILEDQGTAWIDVMSGESTAGEPCQVFVDGMPAGAIMLMPGSNLINVPTAAGSYSAIGPDFECALAAQGYGGDLAEDPGSW